MRVCPVRLFDTGPRICLNSLVRTGLAELPRTALGRQIMAKQNCHYVLLADEVVPLLGLKARILRLRSDSQHCQPRADRLELRNVRLDSIRLFC